MPGKEKEKKVASSDHDELAEYYSEKHYNGKNKEEIKQNLLSDKGLFNDALKELHKDDFYEKKEDQFIKEYKEKYGDPFAEKKNPSPSTTESSPSTQEDSGTGSKNQPGDIPIFTGFTQEQDEQMKKNADPVYAEIKSKEESRHKINGTAPLTLPTKDGGKQAFSLAESYHVSKQAKEKEKQEVQEKKDLFKQTYGEETKDNVAKAKQEIVVQDKDLKEFQAQFQNQFDTEVKPSIDKINQYKSLIDGDTFNGTKEQYDDYLASLENVKRGQENLKIFEDLNNANNKLKQSVFMADYNVKSKEGGFWGATYNSMLTGYGKMAAGAGSLTIDLLAKISPTPPGMTEDQVRKNVKEQLLPGVRGVLKDQYGAKSTTDEYINEMQKTFLGGPWIGLVQSAPAMATPHMAGIFTQVVDDVNQEMSGEKFKDVSENEKLLVSVPIGITSMLLEKFGFKNLAANSPIVKSIVAKSLANLPKNATKEQIEAVLNAETQSAIKNYTIRSLGGFVAEAETGALQEGATIGIKEIYNSIKDKELFETPKNWQELGVDMLKAGVDEGIGGHLMAQPYAISKALQTKKNIGELTNDSQFKMIEGILKDPNYEKTFSEKLLNDVENNHVSHEQAEVVLSDFQRAKKIMSLIPEGLPIEAKRKAFDLLNEKENLSNHDGNLVKGKVEEINSKLTEIGNTKSEDKKEFVPGETVDLSPQKTEYKPGESVELYKKENHQNKIQDLNKKIDTILSKKEVNNQDLQEISELEAEIDNVNSAIKAEVDKRTSGISNKIEALKKERDGLYGDKTTNYEIQQAAKREKEINKELLPLLAEKQKVRLDILQESIGDTNTNKNAGTETNTTANTGTEQKTGIPQQQEPSGSGVGDQANQEVEAKKADIKKREQEELAIYAAKVAKGKETGELPTDANGDLIHSNEIKAKYAAELKALEETAKSTTSNLEAKKAEIKKWKQGELDSVDITKGGKLPIEGYEEFYKNLNTEYNAKLKALESDQAESDIQEFKIGYAPFRQGNIKNLSESEKAFEHKKYQQWRSMAKTFANELGLGISDEKSTVGIYGKTSDNPEASSLVTITGPKEQVKLFAAIMGSMAPDVQNSVMMLKYDKTGTTIEHTITFKDRESAEDFVHNRHAYGIEDISFIPETNSVMTLDFNKGNVKLAEIIKDYGRSITKLEQRNAKSEFVEEPDYSGIIKEARDRRGGHNGAALGKNLDSVLGLAEKRAIRRSGNLSTQSEQKKGQLKDSVKGYFNKFKKAFGLNAPPKTLGPKDIKPSAEKAKRITEAYDGLKKDNSSDPNVKAAYEQLGKETEAQYEYLTKDLGINIEFTENDPYDDSQHMMWDVFENNNLRVFKGGEPHPFLGDHTKDANGVTLNEKLRAIHDYFGHAVEGNQFGKNGEEAAWVAHSKMFSPLAQKALTTETRGQNSWVNTHETNKAALEKFRKGNDLIAEGKVAEGQKIVAEAKTEFQFADQKVDLLPDEFTSWDEYVKEDDGGSNVPPKESTTTSESDSEKKDRRFPKQLDKDANLDDEVKKGLSEEGRYYHPITNKDTNSQANDIINDLGLEKSLEALLDEHNNISFDVRVALGENIIKQCNQQAKKATTEAERKKFISTSIKAADYTAQFLTKLGQGVQAAAMYAKLSPEGVLIFVHRELRKVRDKKLVDAEPTIAKIKEVIEKLNKEVIEEILNLPKVKDLIIDKSGKIEGAAKKKAVKKAIDNLEALKARIKNSQKGNVNNIFQVVGENFAIGGITVAQKALQAGLTISQAINKAIDYIHKEREKSKQAKLTKEQIEAFSSEVREELKSVEAELDPEKAVKRGLKDLDTSIRELVKKHYTEFDKTKKTLVDKLVNEAGLDKAEAKELANTISQEFDKLAKKAKEAALEEKFGLKKKKKKAEQAARGVPEKVKKSLALHDKIVELSNLGALSDQEYRDAYADKMGLPKLSDEQAKKLIGLAEKVQLAPENSGQWRAATEKLLGEIANLKGLDLSDKLMSIWYSFTLSGPTTQLRNIYANTTYIIGETFKEAAYSAGKRDGQRFALSMIGLWHGLVGRGWQEAGGVLRTGVTSEKVGKIGAPMLLERHKFIGGNWNPYNHAKHIGRFMSAVDIFFYHGAKNMRAHQIALMEARSQNKGLPSKEIRDKVYEKLFKTKEARKEAELQATEEGLKGAEYKRRVFEIMDQKIDAKITEQTKLYGLKATFNQDPEGTMGVVTNLLSYATQKFMPLKLIVPFTKILGNVTNNYLEWTPYGFVRVLKGGIGWGENHKKYDAEENAKVLISAVTGTLAMAALLALTADQDDEEEGIEITADLTGDYKKNYEVNKPKYSIRIGKIWFNYQDTPLAIPLAMAGYIRDAERWHSQRELEDRMAIIAFGTIKYASDLSFMKGMSDFFDAFAKSGKEGASSFFREMGKQTVTATKNLVVPNFYTQTKKSLDEILDIPMKNADDMLEKFYRDIPGINSHMNDMVNSLGDPVYPEMLNRFWPFQAKIQKDHQVYDLLNDKNAFVMSLSKPQLEFSLGFAATDEQYGKFQKLRGKYIKERILEEFDDLKSLEPEKVRDRLRNFKEFATKEAKFEVFYSE